MPSSPFTLAARSHLEEIGVAHSPDFDVSIGKLLHSLGIADAADAKLLPRTIAAAWKKFLDLEKRAPNRETIEKICLLGAFYRLTSPSTPELETAFSAERIGFFRSRTEMSLRLASRLFMVGRKAKIARDSSMDSDRLLKVSIRHFDEAAEYEGGLQPRVLRKLFGMRGVAQLLVARGDLSTGNLRRAANDLERSNQFGDDTPQNLVYRRECALRLYGAARQLEDLDRLGQLLEEPSRKDRQYFSDLAWYQQQRALFAIEHDENAGTFLESGLHACEAGLKVPPDANTPDAVFFNLRGFLNFLAAQCQFSSERARSDHHLELAIKDLRLAAAVGLGGASLTQALLRRSASAKLADLASAEADLNEALASICLVTDSTLADRLTGQVKASLLDCDVRKALEAGEAKNLLEACAALLSCDDEATRYAFTLIKAARALLKGTEGGSFSKEVRDTAEAVLSLADRYVQELSPDDENIGIMNGYLGGISRRLDADSVSRRTVGLYRSAVENSKAISAELYSQAADVALQFGKAISKEGAAEEAALMFEDAVRWYEAAFEVFESDPEAVSAHFIPVVCHSKLGEACIRMRSGKAGANAIATKAIEHLTQARGLGNESPELLGLLGDARYRRGYSAFDKSELWAAVELKLSAREFGHLSRENWSIVARIYHRLFEIERDASILAKALDEVFQAHVHSPEWPWPLFQMAELATVPPQSREAAIAQLPEELRQHELAGYVRRGDRIHLLGVAAKLAVEGTEFRRQTLGGRSGAFVLEDPHRLLSTTMVLKPSTQKNAEAEVGATRRFGRHIESLDYGRNYSVPNPIAVIQGEGHNVTYVMERARAIPLSQHLLGPSALGYEGETPELTNALEFLAVYHQWAGVRPSDGRWRRRLISQFGGLLGQFQFNKTDRQRAVEQFASILPNGLPESRKKDAHPENWMVTAAGKIVMIDLESTSWCPALLDVVQLLDDYPVFHADLRGWQTRITLAKRHWKQVFGTDPGTGLVESAYTALLIYRCTFGILFCSNAHLRCSASASVKALEVRLRHFRSLLCFTAGTTFPEMSRTLSSLLVDVGQNSIAKNRMDETKPMLGRESAPIDGPSC